MSYFFDEGIAFTCLQCGRCCTGGSGTIYVQSEEIIKIATFLGFPQDEFTRIYLYPFKDSYSIREKENGDCFFYQKGCLIHTVKPNQCSSFPFWLENLRSVYKWKQTKANCPGIGHGNFYTKADILKIVEHSFI